MRCAKRMKNPFEIWCGRPRNLWSWRDRLWDAFYRRCIELVDYMEKYSPDAWMLNYSILQRSSQKRLVNCALMPRSLIFVICQWNRRTDGASDRFSFSQRVGGSLLWLESLWLWTDIRDKAGNDLLPQIQAHVAKYGYSLPEEIEASQHADASWMHTFAKAKKYTKLIHPLCQIPT